MKDSEVLAAARERLQAGWCQNEALDEEGNVCAVGALDAVLVLSHPSTVPTFNNKKRLIGRLTVAALRIDRQYGGEEGDYMLARWNDADTRTKEDVLLAYKYAEAAAEEEGR
jgi:hypothetical protein